MRTHTLLPWTVLLLVGCGGDPEAVPERPDPKPVRAVAVSQGNAQAATIATGSTEPLRRIQPGTKLLGRIDGVLVEEGERVRAGQVLARVESRDLEAAVAQARAAIDMAQVNLENARAQEERFRKLHAKGSVTDKNLEDATANLGVRQAALAQAEADLRAAEVMLGYAEVRSSASGWVVSKQVEEGDMSVPGAPMFTVEDLSQVKVVVQVPESQVVELAVGGAARVTVLGETRPATIARILPAGDPLSRTFEVQILIDNPDGRLGSGMFARASFGEADRPVLLVPREALIQRGPLQGVFVAGDDGRAGLRWIRTGEESDAGIEVLSGLEAGERVVLEPPADLQDGDPLEVGT